MFFKQEELGNKEEKAIVLPETYKNFADQCAKDSDCFLWVIRTFNALISE
ncbi:putative uncharacterized protein [Odoribacter laneus CAG:561]|nr:putative uncharacterized protein [Odoribacter laneus CAG:561]